MKPTARKLRPALKTHGGKSYLARRIVELFPPHRVYVEPFAGGLSVLLNKPRSAREVAGDLDAELMDFYRVLTKSTAELIDALGPLPYDRDTWMAIRASRPDDELGRAVRTLVVNRWSRGGLGGDFAWSGRLRGGRPGDLNGWETIQAELPRIAERLRGVELHRGDAVPLIREHDAPGTLFYCDPPYLHATRTARSAYRHELTEADHRRQLGVLCECRGPGEMPQPGPPDRPSH